MIYLMRRLSNTLLTLIIATYFLLPNQTLANSLRFYDSTNTLSLGEYNGINGTLLNVVGGTDNDWHRREADQNERGCYRGNRRINRSDFSAQLGIAIGLSASFQRYKALSSTQRRQTVEHFISKAIALCGNSIFFNPPNARQKNIGVSGEVMFKLDSSSVYNKVGLSQAGIKLYAVSNVGSYLYTVSKMQFSERFRFRDGKLLSLQSEELVKKEISKIEEYLTKQKQALNNKYNDFWNGFCNRQKIESITIDAIAGANIPTLKPAEICQLMVRLSDVTSKLDDCLSSINIQCPNGYKELLQKAILPSLILLRENLKGYIKHSNFQSSLEKREYLLNLHHIIFQSEYGSKIFDQSIHRSNRSKQYEKSNQYRLSLGYAISDMHVELSEAYLSARTPNAVRLIKEDNIENSIYASKKPSDNFRITSLSDFIEHQLSVKARTPIEMMELGPVNAYSRLLYPSRKVRVDPRWKTNLLTGVSRHGLVSISNKQYQARVENAQMEAFSALILGGLAIAVASGTSAPEKTYQSVLDKPIHTFGYTPNDFWTGNKIPSW